MANDRIFLFDGKVKAHKVGGFMKEGFAFDIVRPGVDIQGRNRLTWTQIIWKGIPVWEMKTSNDLPTVMEKFNSNWGMWFGENKALALKAMEAEVADRRDRFQDGTSGVEIAPNSQDDKPTKKYPA